MKYLKPITESIKDKELLIIRGDDWEGVYYEGKLLTQTRNINWIVVLEKLGYEIKSKYLKSEESIDIFGDLPKTLEELELKLNTKKYNL
jgi:hypothetical protein